MGIKEIWLEDVDWINLAQNRDEWCEPVNTVMNFWTHKKCGESLD
jgi:hypothetical protein